jgi:glycosyltransferase involved in cell wall biosynthesis
MALLLESLAARGVAVDVLMMYGEEHLAPKPFGDTIRLECLFNEYIYKLLWDEDFWPKNALRRFPKRLALKLFSPKLYRCYQVRYDPVLWWRKAARYDVIVGVDPIGMAWADLYNRKAKKPLAYISFELMFGEEAGDFRYLCELERAACAHTSLVLIQDDERAAAFCRETSFDPGKIVKVPVAPPPQPVQKSDFLRRELGISPERKLVLYCGNLEVWASRDQLAEMVSYWPDNFCLVVHSFAKYDQTMSFYLDGLKATGKVHLTSHPVSRDELPTLIASADFGLAPYLPVPGMWTGGRNLYHLGLASGKVAFYAHCGLPILARSLPTYERELTNYRCGKVYRRVADTGNLLSEMNREYDSYSGEARRFYRERLDPTAGMREFCDRLLTLAV